MAEADIAYKKKTLLPDLRFREFKGEWKSDKLGKLAKVTSGGTPNRSINNYWGGDIPWITTSLINFNRINTAEEYITAEAVSNSSAKKFPVGTILMAMYGQGKTRGKVAMLAIEATTNQACAAIIASENILKTFLYHSLSGRYEEIRGLSNEGGQQNLSGGIIKEINVQYPSLPEQKKIASFLSAVDEKIQLLTRKKELLEQYKKGVMQQLFSGKLRFKDDNGEDYPDWEEIKLLDIADKKTKYSFTGGPFGSDLKASDYTEKGVRIIQLQNIGDGAFLNDYKIYTSEQKADKLVSCNIFPGDILLSKMGDPVARACKVPPFEERYLMASDGIRLVPDRKRFDCDFIFYSINNNTFRSKAISLSTGSTRKRIGLTELRNIELNIPVLAEQEQIGRFLSALDKKIELVSTQITLTQKFKKGLLQQMFV